MAKKQETSTTTYSGVEIVTSKKYKRYHDILCILLDEDKRYTEEEIQEILDTELSRIL